MRSFSLTASLLSIAMASASASASSPTPPTPPPSGPAGPAGSYDIYTTGYAADVNLLRFTPPSNLSLVDTLSLDKALAPSWLTFLPPSAGAERSVLLTDESAPGGGYIIDRLSSSWRVSPRAEAGGDGCVASDVDLKAGCAYTANYDSGSLSVLPLSISHAHPHRPSPGSGAAAGGVERKLSPASQVLNFTRPGVGPVTNRQAHSYAHDVVLAPDGRWVFVVDLGADVIRVLRPAGAGCADAKHVADIAVASGSGPRHIKFLEEEKGTYAYLSSEFANTITSFLYSPSAPAASVLTQIGSPAFAAPPAIALGGNAADGPKRTLAEVQVSRDGRFVYTSNRGDDEEDHVSLLTRDEEGRASWKYWYPSGGRNPRHFDISPDGAFLAVAHQNTNSVAVLRTNATDGSLEKVASLDGLEQVAFAGFAPVAAPK